MLIFSFIIVAPIIECASLTGYSCKHGISVTWTVHPDVQAQRFTVAVRTPEQLIGTAIVEVEDRSKEKYTCTFGLKNYDEKQEYSVKVTAERTGNRSVSSRSHEVNKGVFKLADAIPKLNTEVCMCCWLV